MKFSIIVPIYQVEKYLRQCIDSILSQNFSDFELILIDDGSRDNSPLICDEYSKSDKRVRVVHKHNEGLVKARQTGASVAKGEYIVNVDGDDFIQNNYLASIYDIIEKNNPDIVCIGWTAFDEISTHIVFNSVNPGFYSDKQINRIINGFLYDETEKGVNNGTIGVSIWSKIVRKELYVDAQMKVDPKISKGEDSLFILNLLPMVKSAYVMNYSGYYYRLNESSMMHKIKENDFIELFNLIQEMMKIKSNDLDNQILATAYHRLYNLILQHMSVLKKFKSIESDFNNNIPDELLDIASNFIIKKPKTIDKLRFFLIKNKKWLSIYLLWRFFLNKKNR